MSYDTNLQLIIFKPRIGSIPVAKARQPVVSRTSIMPLLRKREYDFPSMLSFIFWSGRLTHSFFLHFHFSTSPYPSFFSGPSLSLWRPLLIQLPFTLLLALACGLEFSFPLLVKAFLISSSRFSMLSFSSL